MNRKFRTAAVIFFSAGAIASAGFGVYKAMRSPLFTVRVVEVADQPENAPVDAHTISILAAVPVGTTNLFELPLAPIERRILANSWIREVKLQKRFPQTLAISVVFREPQALLQTTQGALAYVDSDGKVFGDVTLMVQPDLPILSGFSAQPQTRVVEALKLLAVWSASKVGAVTQISNLSYDPERGFRALVTYPVFPKGRGRTLVELGQEIDAELDASLARLEHVFRYLATNGIAARQIWADTGKKIVVKIARRS
jgi:cell division septal protein FtsQ